MDNTTLMKDFREFLQLFNENQVDYLVVGGFAVGSYGYPRATSDIDVWVSMSAENAELVSKSLVEFGFSEKTVQSERFTKPDQIFQMGVPPIRVDILTTIGGVDYAECKARAEVRKLDGMMVPMISLEDLKTNKQATGRHKDLDDLEKLTEISSKQPPQGGTTNE